MPSCSLVGRLFTAVKRACISSDDPPVHVGEAYDPAPAAEQLWLVTATLTRKAPFGAVTSQSQCWAGAASQSDALRFGEQQLLKSHPGFTVSMISAARAPAG